MQTDERRINHNRCNNGLEDTDYGSLFTNLFELRDAELVTYCECDKTERNVRDYGVGCNVLVADKADAGNADKSENVRADENTCNEVCGYGRELKKLCHTGEHKSRKECDGKT